MAGHREQFEDDEIAEILKLAIRKQDSTTPDLRRRLMDAADELGISPEAVAEAEKEYRQTAYRNRQLAAFQKEGAGALRIHAGVYVIVNIFLAALNVLAYEKGDGPWCLFVVLGWGVGLAIHALVAKRKVDWDDEEFQKWLRKREELEDD